MACPITQGGHNNVLWNYMLCAFWCKRFALIDGVTTAYQQVMTTTESWEMVTVHLHVHEMTPQSDGRLAMGWWAVEAPGCCWRLKPSCLGSDVLTLPRSVTKITHKISQLQLTSNRTTGKFCSWGLIFLLLWHAPLRAVLSQVDSFIQCEVVGSQVSLDGVQPRETGTPWWSLPVIWRGSR